MRRANWGSAVPRPPGFGRSLRLAARCLPPAVACALLLLISPALTVSAFAQEKSGSPAEKLPEANLVLFSYSSDNNQLAVSYTNLPEGDSYQQDFANLAKEVGISAPKLQITRAMGSVTVEAQFPKLTDWSQGTVNLDAFIRTFRRFGRFRLACFFMGKFPMKAAEPIQRGPVKVTVTANGNTLDYHVWIDQSGGVPRQIPSVRGREGFPWLLVLGAVAGALLLGFSLFLVVSGILSQRRESAARQESPDAHRD